MKHLFKKNNMQTIRRCQQFFNIELTANCYNYYKRAIKYFSLYLPRDAMLARY